MKSGNLNFLEPSGPLQAFNGTALPFTFTLKYSYAFVGTITTSNKQIKLTNRSTDDKYIV